MTAVLAYIAATLSSLFLLAATIVWIVHWQYGTYEGGARRMLHAANALTAIAAVLALLTGGLAL